MSEFGGLQKHEKTQHTLVGLGSAALASHTQIKRPKFSERDKKMYNKQIFKKQFSNKVSFYWPGQHFLQPPNHHCTHMTSYLTLTFMIQPMQMT